VSDEEKQPQGGEPPVEEHQDHNHSHVAEETQVAEDTHVVEDARTRALAEALQSSFKVVRVLMVVLAVAFLGSGITKVGPGEKALLLRFGAFQRPLPPGLHFALPNPIETIEKVNVSKKMTITSDVGWGPADEDGNPEDSFSFEPEYHGYTLTGNGNTVHIKAIMNYRLEDSEKAIKAYAFNFDDVTDFLQSALDNAVYHASANHSALDALKLTELEEDIRERFKKVVNDVHELPIVVEGTIQLKVQVPGDVEPAFEAFGTSETVKKTTISEAKQKARNMEINAEGQAKVIQSGGETIADRLLTLVEAEAKSFAEQRPYYESNPELFRQRLLTGTMQRVLTNAVDVFYLSGRTPRIWLNRTPEKRKLKEGGAP
jgi:regulator of protease activity HflC (stomatin/prohibitin superfamily)